MILSKFQVKSSEEITLTSSNADDNDDENNVDNSVSVTATIITNDNENDDLNDNQFDNEEPSLTPLEPVYLPTMNYNNYNTSHPTTVNICSSTTSGISAQNRSGRGNWRVRVPQCDRGKVYFLFI